MDYNGMPASGSNWSDRSRDLLRNVKRLLTYSPFALLKERKLLASSLKEWKDRHLFLFPYLNTGGAEQVHVDIVATVKDHEPLILITGFSRDRAFAEKFAEHGTLLELPRLLNHPFTRRAAHQRIAASINNRPKAVLFSSNTSTFFQLLPLLDRSVRTYYLQHAFLYQADGNAQHKAWLRHVLRVDGYLFISSRAKEEFARFLFAKNLPGSTAEKLHLISNAVHRFGTVREHERLGLLFVGRDSEEKRLPLFLALTARLERERPGRYRFSVVGGGPVEGHPHVTFHGRINDADRMATIQSEHDILVLTSSREGFPLVIMEAMAQGLVVLSTPVGDVPVRLSPDVAVIATDISAETVLVEFTDAVLALDADRSRLQRMKAAALAKARLEFDPERFVQDYRSLLIRP